MNKNLKIFSILIIAICFIDCDKDQSTNSRNDNGNGNKGDISMITPYFRQSDMASINEAFSISNASPWGFEHRGIDFFPNGNLRPFRAVSSGVIDHVQLWQLESTLNWQVSILLIYNDTYAVNYAFEPMTPSQADGQVQLDNIRVTVNQTVSQGDTIGFLYTAGNGAHVDFGLLQNWEGICPEPYFTPEARLSILSLIHVVWPGAEMCY